MFDPKQMNEEFQKKRERIEQALIHCIEPLKEKTVLYASIAYSLFSGGKRIRPLFLISSYETMSNGNNINPAIIPACAIELIHTYSLIHDDLPCMDNSDKRRGKATNHIIYGDDIALLAGDALLTHAFTTITSKDCKKYLDDEQIVQLVQCLSYHSGIDGMVEGQAFELIQEDQKMENLHYIDEHKTAALFSASFKMGGIAAKATNKQLAWLSSLGRSFGHAFQIADDIVDYDPHSKESNIVKLLGKEKSIALYQQHMIEVNSILDQIYTEFKHPSLRNLITWVQKKANFL